LKFPKLLAETTGGEVHCLDLAGFGTEALRVPPVTVRANADEIRTRFLQLSQGKGRWACLGHSMGGMIALDWSKRYPRDFDRLVLINTSSKDVGAFHHRISVFGLYCLLRASFSENGLERERQILKMISNLKMND